MRAGGPQHEVFKVGVQITKNYIYPQPFWEHVQITIFSPSQFKPFHEPKHINPKSFGPKLLQQDSCWNEIEQSQNQVAIN